MAEVEIRQGSDADMAALVELSLLAWEPVFDSFRQIMGPAVFPLVYPDWRQIQGQTVKTFCRERENAAVWVAEVAGQVVGFVACEMKPETKTGEVLLLAVHPDYQNEGIGTELNQVALAKMKAAGMRLAVVSTGGDPGHAPARRAYEKVSYRAFPQVWYFQDL